MGLQWYWHRLRAMGAAEVSAHLRKKLRHWKDASRVPDWGEVVLKPEQRFPPMPSREPAPGELVAALRRDRDRILAGRWRAFGLLELRVDDPPHWDRDYLAGVTVPATDQSFRLNHRALPSGADIKLIWELSRWYELVRLAQAAWLLGDEAAGQKCLHWLEDWLIHNRPFRGWNWTSGLEAGMRLIQFTWMHALLEPEVEGWGNEAELDRLCYEVLPPHAWYAWRYRSFGSSANNHLLGELAGLVVASARWPALARWCAPLEVLHAKWEQEVLAQFTEDGGNREQALHYHLFSWEFCWQTRAALLAANRKISPAVEDRLERARRFFVAVQPEVAGWDYGDSDDAFVTPFFADEQHAVAEWRRWMQAPEKSPAIQFWLAPLGGVRGDSRMEPPAAKPSGWEIFSATGIGVRRAGPWFLRWDLSPLGYLATAAHGHLDALHLSMWYRGRPVVIDPGTGAYYAEAEIRTRLASWAAHNGPHRTAEDYPRRLGTFLWEEPHTPPVWTMAADGVVTGEVALPGGLFRRTVRGLERDLGWQVEDEFFPPEGQPGAFDVHWQFDPEAAVESVGERAFRWACGGDELRIVVDGDWKGVELRGREAGFCSPGFRRLERSVGLRLRGEAHNSCVFRTSFLASGPS